MKLYLQGKKDERENTGIVRLWLKYILVKESKERVHEDFGRRLSTEYSMENKKLFSREVRKEMGGRISEACRIKRSDGVTVRQNEELREESLKR